MIGITFLYMFYPYISFMLSGFDWSITSDSRLKGAGADSKSLGSFAWYHVSYLLALTAGYLFFRPTSPIKHLKKDLVIKQFEVKVALVVLIGIILYEILVPIVFGESPPYFFLQLSNMLGSVKFVFTIFFIAFCLSHWKIKIMPLILFGYLGYEVFNIFIGEAGRTWVFLHFCAFVLLYDRLVSPMTLKQIIIIGLIAIVAFLALGFFRHGVFSALSSGFLFISGSNEFTSLLGTAYDLNYRKEVLGTLSEIRWQVYFDDIIYLIPSQLLPFEKLDLSSWYMTMLPQQSQGKGVGFMFGVTSQAIVGGGIAELLIRGFITGAFFAWLHKIYLRNSDSFWMLVLYVFIAIKSYYIFRASTGYLPYFIIYNYLPAYLAVKFITKATLNAVRKDYLVHTQN